MYCVEQRLLFFAFLGFDAVSTAAQETKNPKRDMPVGILGSLLICTILYMVFAYVMTGVAHYSDFAGQQGIAPVAVAIDHMGHADATGVIHPDYPWLNRAIATGYPVWLLLGYYGNFARTKPCISKYEPRRTVASFLFKDSREIPDTGTQ